MIENPILSLSIIFILSFFSSRLAKKLKLPTITAYIVLGIIISPNILNLVSQSFLSMSDFFSDIVLGLIAFTLGESFSFNTLRRIGRSVTAISISASLTPWLLVTLVLWLLFKQPFFIALIFGAIASATAPAAVVTVIQEYKSKGEFTDTLLGIVALDDAWALIIFGLSLALAKSGLSEASRALDIAKDLLKAFIEIAGSFALGYAISFIFNKLSGFINTAKDRLIFILGFITLAIGLSIALKLSILLTCMSFGALLVNSNKENFQFFEALRDIDAPLYLIFFVLAGAHLNISLLGVALAATLGFIAARTAGKITGAFVGAKICQASKPIVDYMGLALIPQAGIALACALLAKHAIGGYWGERILTITIASTVFFELFGPWITKYSLQKAGDISQQS